MISKWNNNKDGIVYFTWSLCRYCKIVEPTIMELSKEHDIIYYLTDDHGWPSQFNVELVPALIEFKDGEIVRKISGILTTEDVTNFITGGNK